MKKIVFIVTIPLAILGILEIPITVIVSPTYVQDQEPLYKAFTHHCTEIIDGHIIVGDFERRH